MKKLVFIFLVVTGSLTFAKDEKKAIVSLLVDDYFKNQSPFNDECRSPGMDCVDAVCNNLGTLGCDDRSEIDEVLKMCRGNFDGECIRVACKHLGSLGCDDRSEIQEVARACVGNFGGECVNAVCRRLGQLGCDDRSEIIDVINKCAGN
ncbi:MAG: hypothetical protein A4S09_03240 [Proteobacteria bacterium SG_bin7]|nr:MAG: hypothetical protein A4S09_03240 [Proteobacteria bacterium SG_bin7]